MFNAPMFVCARCCGHACHGPEHQCLIFTNDLANARGFEISVIPPHNPDGNRIGCNHGGQQSI